MADPRVESHLLSAVMQVAATATDAPAAAGLFLLAAATKYKLEAATQPDDTVEIQVNLGVIETVPVPGVSMKLTIIMSLFGAGLNDENNWSAG